MLYYLMVLLMLFIVGGSIVGLIAGYLTFGQLVLFILLCVGLRLLFAFLRYLLKKAEGKTGLGLLLILGMMAVFFFSGKIFVGAYSEGVLVKSLQPFYQDGNAAYATEDWALAETNYRDALKGKYEPEKKIESKKIADVVNNLALALLQQQKNEEALSLITAAVQAFPEEGGYWMNYLVAAQANGETAKAAIQKIGQFAVLAKLASAAAKKPGPNLPYLNGIAYNLVYMDMEQALADEVYTDIPLMLWSNDTYVKDPSSWAETLDARLNTYHNILLRMQKNFNKAYGQEDSDIAALLAYLEAKMDAPV